MLQRSGRYKYQVFAMDFETHSDKELIDKFLIDPLSVETSIWLWYLIDDKMNYDDKDSHGYDLKSFFDRLEFLSRPKKRQISKVLIYDYNLAFEFSFMFPYMEKIGFKYKNEIKDEDSFVYNLVCNSSLSNVWEIKLKFYAENSIIKIRDLAKILGGGTLRRLAQSYKLETQKGDIDYSLNRRVQNYQATEEEKIYCYKDVKIIMDILTQPAILKDKEFWKSISSASYSFSKGIKFGYKNYFKPKQAYRRDYPELDKKESNFLRNSVGGGICYAVPRYQYKTIEQGKIYNNKLCNGIIHIDMHNAHPSQMYKKEFPYKEGIYYQFKGKAILKPKVFTGHLFSNHITCVRCIISYTSVKLHSQIRLIGIESTSGFEITVWDFEIPTMYKCYENLKIMLIDAYVYKKKKLPFCDYFKFNYDERKKAKKIKDYYHINYYKLLNNSFYGKLLEHGHNEIFIPFTDEDGINTTFKKEIEETADDYNINGTYTYIPAGSCVPAYTRVWLIETALGNVKNYTPPKDFYKNIIYFDTDSIFMLDNEETQEFIKHLEVKDDLYNWGFEEHITRAQFACPKRYKLDLDSKITEAHLAGFNVNGQFEEINIINSEHWIYRGYRIKGGTIIAPQRKVLSVDNKYRMIYDKNKESE